MQPATPQASILVFDSGVGGLSVLQEIRSRLPDCHYLYAFDNACFPYGKLTEPQLVDRCVRVIAAVMARHAVDLVVIACNTASTAVLPVLRERFRLPVVGVVPAIKPAAQLTRSGVIGVLATPGTVQRAYTHNLIAQYASHLQVELLGSCELVYLAEQKLRGESLPPGVLAGIVGPLLERAPLIDTLVLGCTHFPLLKEELQLIVGEAIRLLDSGAAIARRVASLLMEQPQVNSKGPGVKLAYCTGELSSPQELLQVLGSFGLERLELLSC